MGIGRTITLSSPSQPLNRPAHKDFCGVWGSLRSRSTEDLTSFHEVIKILKVFVASSMFQNRLDKNNQRQAKSVSQAVNGNTDVLLLTGASFGRTNM